jgi:hypothetical protein
LVVAQEAVSTPYATAEATPSKTASVELSFYEYIAQSRKMALRDTHTLLAMAGVPLGFPDEEETVRLLNRDKKRQPAGGKALKTIVPLDSQPLAKARKRI